VAGLALAGVGVVGLAAGTFFGLQAIGKLHDSNDGHCDSTNTCDSQGVALRSDVKTSALVSTIAFSVGVVALGGGAALYFTAPQPSAPGIAVGGRW
jgi:hypothetical protein